MLILFVLGTTTTGIDTLSLHDALPILRRRRRHGADRLGGGGRPGGCGPRAVHHTRSEEHTSELQSRPHLVCRLLLEKKKIPDRADASPTQLTLEDARSVFFCCKRSTSS